MRHGTKRALGWTAAALILAAIAILALPPMVKRASSGTEDDPSVALEMPHSSLMGDPGGASASAEEVYAEVFSPRRRQVEPPPAAQLEDYQARRPKTVLELQPFREASSIRIEDAAGRIGTATLSNLNPYANDWHLLHLEWPQGGETAFYHLENADPEGQALELDERYLHGLMLRAASGNQPCNLWGDGGALAATRVSQTAYGSLCQERIFLRNPTSGRKTSKELVTDFLRDHVWRGERITVFVRENFFQDAFLETSEVIAANSGHASRPRAAGAPPRPRIDARVEASYLTPTNLGIHLDGNGSNGNDRVLVGRWYPARDNPGIFVSTIQPKLVAPEVIESVRGLLNPLDDVEESALVYMVAFDLDEFDVGFALGTEHPRVGWSDRVPASVRDDSVPGPDGIGTVEPLIMTGMVSPADAARIAATFTGGFKRTHGAFKWSDLATRNSGSHYGFIEHGTVLSKLQPGLATALVYDDGRVGLETWTDRDVTELARIRHARQNGVPIIDFDPESGASKPGALVRQWTLGNWSGSQDKRFRTLRAGLCLQESEAGRFLVYGYFSSATPSAMARVFQAYECKYAMLLDMNALEHTYLAIYRQRESRFLIQHLIQGMEVLDKSSDGQDLPRFVGFADNRDYFYLLRRERP